jgi:hypothetical protein
VNEDAHTSVASDYFQAVEDFFVSRRGEPLILSTSEWFLVWKWRKAGIPLRVVLRGITDALDSHVQSWGNARRVRRLQYCSVAVEDAAERWRRAVGAAQTYRSDAAALLDGQADALSQAVTFGATVAAMIPGLVMKLRKRARSAKKGVALDKWLATREQELVAAVLQDLGPKAATQLLREVKESLARYSERLPKSVLEQVEREALTRRALVVARLPRLSLVDVEH